MKKGKKKSGLITFTPQLEADDKVANYWMRQSAIRLRREVCWRWQEQGLQPAERTAVLPPFTDKAAAALDLSRFWEEKKKFYEIDPTAQYLTKQLEEKPPRTRRASCRQPLARAAVAPRSRRQASRPQQRRQRAT